MKKGEVIIRAGKICSLISLCSGGVGVALIALGWNIFSIPGSVFGMSCLLTVTCGWVAWNSHMISQNLFSMIDDPNILASEDELRLKRHLLRGTHGVAWLF